MSGEGRRVPRDPELRALFVEATRSYAVAGRLAEELDRVVDDLRRFVGQDGDRDSTEP